MTSITNHTHPLTQVTMPDGTRYDVTVSFLDQNGKPLPLEDFHNHCKLDKEQLSSLLKAITETHANYAKITSFRNIKVMTLTNEGMAFDQKPIQAHDIDVDKSKINTFTQDTPNREFLNTCNKVSDVWNKASGLILEDYNYHDQERITAEVDENAADAAAFTLTRKDNHDQDSVTIHTVPLKKEPDSSDDEGPTPPGYSVRGALNAVRTGLYSVGTAFNTEVAAVDGLCEGLIRVGQAVKGLYNNPTSGSTLTTSENQAENATNLWPEKLTQVTPETIRNQMNGLNKETFETLKSLRQNFKEAISQEKTTGWFNKSTTIDIKNNPDDAFQTLINEMYEATKNLGFGAFIRALEIFKTNVVDQRPKNPTHNLTAFLDELPKKIAEAAIEKLKAHIKTLEEQTKQAEFKAIYPVLIDSSINSTGWTAPYFTDTIYKELFP